MFVESPVNYDCCAPADIFLRPDGEDYNASRIANLPRLHNGFNRWRRLADEIGDGEGRKKLTAFAVEIEAAQWRDRRSFL